ncbi:MAG TPA: hypothetical protein VGZ47_14455 [Gemmataceae bacterium]|jgi:hypothetical protein|nr:hypothetical protein [Gemmataceae bacterium]
MKLMIPILALATVLTGCWSVPKRDGDSKASPKLKQEAKKAEELPIITRDLVKESNANDIAKALDAEMTRDAKDGSVASAKKQ